MTRRHNWICTVNSIFDMKTASYHSHSCLENVHSTSVLSKIHKMFLRFLFSQSQFDHLRYNSLTLALSQKLLVNLLDPIPLSLVVWSHRNFRWLLILSIGSAYIHVKMATSYLSRNMITTHFRHLQNLVTRLLPKKNFREPFGLLKFKVRSPSHIVRSPVWNPCIVFPRSLHRL